MASLAVRQCEPIESTEALRVAPRSKGTVHLLEKFDSEFCPGVFVIDRWLETNVRDDVTHPVWYMEDIIQADCVAVFAPGGTSYLELDRTNAFDRYKALI